MKDLKAVVADHPFLRGLNLDHLEIVLRHAREAEFTPGQVIFRESDAAYEFLLLLEGEVAVESYVPRGDNVPLQTLTAGDVLGWSWLFPPFTWHFQARAVTPARAVVIDGARLLVACHHDADLGFELMQRVAQTVIHRLQSTRKHLLEYHAEDGSILPVDETAFQQDLLPSTAQSLERRLAEHPFLKGLRQDHLAIVADAAMEKEFAVGERIFAEGEIANRFYLIEHGKLILETRRADDGVLPIQIIGDGDVLGWSWLFPPFYWHFDARALAPTKSIFVFGTRLREECASNHEFGYELMKRVCQVLIHRLQATRKQLLAAREAVKGPARLIDPTAGVTRLDLHLSVS